MLHITFNKDGSVEMTPTGYPGGECRRVTDYYRAKMSGRVTSDVPTSEAHEPERNRPEAAPRQQEAQ